MRWTGILLLAMASGCGEDGVIGSIGGGGGGDNGIGSADVPSNATLTDSWEGNLNEGAPANDIGFIEQVQCAPATQNDKFNGNIVWYTYDQPAEKQVYVVVDPERGVDVSLIVAQNPEGDDGTGEADLTGLCEVGVDYTGPNAGEEESAKVTSVSKGYRVIIGVAGAFGETEGAFEVEVYEE